MRCLTDKPGRPAPGARLQVVVEALEARRLLSTVPAGFAETQLASGLVSPSGMAIAPDGRIFVAQQNGTILLLKNNALAPNPVAQLTVDSSGEHGLMSVGVDENFANDHYLYVYYTAPVPASHNRISRLTLSGDTAVAGSETILLDLPAFGNGIWHMGGGIHFGPDGDLYVGVGDALDTSLPQSLNTPYGKILRIKPDGTIPTDNPFYNQTTGVNRAIWAYGLRNPYTSAFQPGTGLYYINDVGQDSWEEIDKGIAGGNYGWPNTEGATSNPAYQTPVYTYAHPGAITGGDFYNPQTPSFPNAYVGKYFFTDFVDGWIQVLDPATKQVSGFATGASFPEDVRVAADGSLYYLSRGQDTGGQPATGAIYRIVSTTSNAPGISIQPAPQKVAVGEAATFTVTATGTGTLSYQWQRNNVNITGATASSYTLPPAATADNGAQFRVIVRNATGPTTSDAATLTVVQGHRPTANITLPAAGTIYRAGDTIQYSATATDTEDGTLPASAYTWQVDFHHHDPGAAAHSHPFIAPTSGIKSGSFTVPNVSETDPDVFYRILLTVTDSSGLTYSTYRDITPHLASFTIATNVAGLTLSIDGQPQTLPDTISGVTGITRTLFAPAQQTANGVTYAFSSWSDGGAATHNISTPESNTNYTANYVVSTVTYLSDLTPLSGATNGWGPIEKDQSVGEQGAGDGKTITLNGVPYAKGLGAHASSDVSYALSGKYTGFLADVGVDDEVGAAGSVTFQVYLDGALAYDSGTLTGSSASGTVNLNVTGKNTLRLVVTDSGNGNDSDHADWAGARVTSGSGGAGGSGGAPTATLFAAPVSYGTGAEAHGVANADFNGDGFVDLAVANAGSDTVSVLFGNGNGTFKAAANYAVGNQPKSVFIKDLNGDGKLDLIVACQGTGVLCVLINKGDGTYNAAVNYASPPGSHDEFSGDFNGDGKPDIAVVGWGDTVVCIFINKGDGTFLPGVNYSVGSASAPHSIIAADFNGDHILDLAVADRGTNNVSVLLGNGNGTFKAASFLAVGANPHQLRTGDFNKDGFADLATANDGSDNVSVLLGTGTGTFKPAVNYAAGSVPKGVAIGDVNGDGALDLVVADTGGNYPAGDNAAGKVVSVLLGKGDGTFGSPTSYPTGHTPFGVVLGDFNGDNKLDVATANWHSNDVTVLLSSGTSTTPPANVAPVAADDSATTTSGAAVQIAALANDKDNDGTLVPSTVSLTAAPAHGTAVVNTSTGVITYTPAASFTGTDTLSYTVKDNSGAASNAAKVTITVNAAGTPSGTSAFVSDLSYTVVANGWGPAEKDKSNGEQGSGDGRTLAMHGVTYPKGLGVHASSEVDVNLGGTYSLFQSDIGIDDETGGLGSVDFQIFADGAPIYDSGGVTAATATQHVSVSVSGKSALRLVVTDAGDGNNSDHADWAGAQLVGNSTPMAPAAPLGLVAQPGNARIVLSWSASSGATGYNIYRGASAGAESATPVNASPITTTTFTDTPLTNGTAYYYQVTAVNAAGPSPRGSEKSATPSAAAVGSLSGTQAAAASSYNLATLGASDWAHWGRGGSFANVDHKATGGSQISAVSIVGAGSNNGGWSDPSRSFTWTGGTPTSAATSDHGYIWSNGAVNTGFSFSVPADTTTRTLTVYAGGNNISSSLTAHLSDGSAVDYAATASAAGLYSNVYTITYRAASANQKLVITLLKTANLVRTDGSVDLIGATLS